MSSPISSWEITRSSSFSSQESREDSQAETRSPPQQAFYSPYSHDARPLSSSLGSATYREPIRSFLPGSVRETLGLLPYYFVSRLPSQTLVLTKNVPDQPPSTASNRRCLFGKIQPSLPATSSRTRRAVAVLHSCLVHVPTPFSLDRIPP